MPTLIAHRGFAGEQPENTLRAFRAAARSAEMIELDVRRCETGEVVVLHDERLDRVTDLRGPVAATPYDALADCDVLGSGEGIPRLVDVFGAVPPSIGVNVELKTAEVAADAVEIAGMAPHDVIVSSFLPEALRRAADAGDPGGDEQAASATDLGGATGTASATDLDGAVGAASATDLPLGYLFHAHEVDRPVDRALSLGCEYLHPPTGVTDAALVDAAHANGLGVNAWTVRARPAARRLVEAGVDGLIADRADVLG